MRNFYFCSRPTAALLMATFFVGACGLRPIGTLLAVDGSSLPWEVGTRSASATEHLAREWITNGIIKEVVLKQNRYVEVGSGLNYLDDEEVWRQSRDLIELTSEGSAAARQGAYKVYFAANINSVGAITTVTASNRTFQTHILGLYYYDAASGKSALISGLRNSFGELLPPNQIVYRNAFELIRADVRMTYTRAATESDLILLERPKPPEAYGLPSATTRLELWHEFLNLEEPQRTTRVLQSETNSALRANMAEPDLIEEILNFGDIWFPQGRAFLTSGEGDRNSDTSAKVTLPSSSVSRSGSLTAKQWLTIDNRKVLIESIPWFEAESELASLPEMASAARSNGKLFASRQLPVRKTPGGSPKGEIRLASTRYKPSGYVLDYIEVSGSGDFTFETGNTYYVSSSTYFSGALTFQPGCTIKFASGAYLLTSGSAAFDPYYTSPTVFTSKDDDSFGETLPNSTHVPGYAASPAVWFYFVDQALINNVQIRWANQGIRLDYCDSSQAIANAAFEFCISGINASCGCSVFSSTKCSVLSDGDGLSDICGADGDSDGLPDLWEYQNFGHLGIDPNADPDGDGLTNLQEYQEGTNPLNQDSDGDHVVDQVFKVSICRPRSGSCIP